MISNLEYFNGKHQYISDKVLSYELPNRLLSLSGSVSAFIILPCQRSLVSSMPFSKSYTVQTGNAGLATHQMEMMGC